MLLGVWGALVPLVGPYFDYAYTPDRAWAFTSGRVWLSIVPGAVTALAGLVVLLSANRAVAVVWAWLAAVAGAWFVVGSTLSTLWTDDGASAAGEPVGGTAAQAAEQLGFFTGLGAAIVFFAAMALGRFTVLGAREMAMAERDAAAADALHERDHDREHDRDHDREPDRTEQLPAEPQQVTTTPAATYSASTVDDGPVSERTARRLDDHPDERLRPESPEPRHHQPT